MAESSQISFMIDNQNYGIDIMSVRAIERCDNISPVIGAPNFIKGVLNLRGELIPVYSIRSKFALPDKPYDNNTMLILVKLEELSVAIIVDSVVGIINVMEKQVRSRPEILSDVSTDFVGHVAELDNKKIILLISLPHLIPAAERKAMIDMLETGKED